MEILPKWGGKIETKNDFTRSNIYENFSIIDTCTIDYFLLAISFSSLLNENIIPMLDASSLINEKNPLVANISKIIKLVLANEWNLAKTIWILDVIKLKPQRRRFSTFGDEHEFFISFVN